MQAGEPLASACFVIPNLRKEGVLCLSLEAGDDASEIDHQCQGSEAIGVAISVAWHDKPIPHYRHPCEVSTERVVQATCELYRPFNEPRRNMGQQGAGGSTKAE